MGIFSQNFSPVPARLIFFMLQDNNISISNCCSPSHLSVGRTRGVFLIGSKFDMREYKASIRTYTNISNKEKLIFINTSTTNMHRS
jgi:hypothetical protein